MLLVLTYHFKIPPPVTSELWSPEACTFFTRGTQALDDILPVAVGREALRLVLAILSVLIGLCAFPNYS